MATLLFQRRRGRDHEATILVVTIRIMPSVSKSTWHVSNCAFRPAHLHALVRQSSLRGWTGFTSDATTYPISKMVQEGAQEAIGGIWLAMEKAESERLSFLRAAMMPPTPTRLFLTQLGH